MKYASVLLTYLLTTIPANASWTGMGAYLKIGPSFFNANFSSNEPLNLK